jgi:hypothetical protein
MTAWRDVEEVQPEFAERVRALFNAHRHKTIATLLCGPVSVSPVLTKLP